MKCRSCKEDDLRPSHRKKAEEILAYLLPIEPFRCNSCDHRQYGLIQPLFDKPRIISASAFGLILIVTIVIFSWGPSPESASPAPADDVVDAEREEVVHPAQVADDRPTEPDAEGADSGDGNLIPDAGDGQEKFTTMAEKTGAPVEISEFVREQLEKNQAKRNKSEEK